MDVVVSNRIGILRREMVIAERWNLHVLNYVFVVNVGFGCLSTMVRRKTLNMWICIDRGNILTDLPSRLISFANTRFPGRKIAVSETPMEASGKYSEVFKE